MRAAGTRRSTIPKNSGVIGDVDTNSVKGLWSLYKRSIVGSFHKISTKQVARYLEELEWRFNSRHNPEIFRDALRKIVGAGTLTCRDLVA